MKVVFAHICYEGQAEAWHRAVARSAPLPLEVTALPLALPGRSGRLSWAELDLRWRHRDRELLKLYEGIQAACEGADVLWNYNGAMLHPEFVAALPCRTVYSCFDDPEDFPDLAAPVAPAYDYALYGNVASGPLFAASFQQCDWLPIFTDTGEYDHAEAHPDYDQRDIDLVFAGGISGYSDYRQRRLLHLAEAFPQAICVGRGWPRGYVERHEVETLYRRARVGWNVHRTTGPVNQRLFDLARFGVAQVCDNAPHLGRVFALEKEILGFGPISEAVRQIRRLLNDDHLRRAIAVAARERYEHDYIAPSIWNRFAHLIQERLPAAGARTRRPGLPAPAWLNYRTRARAARLACSVRRGWRAAHEVWRQKPDYLTWRFDESAVLPARHTRDRDPEAVPATVVTALAGMLYQDTGILTDSVELKELLNRQAIGLRLAAHGNSGRTAYLSVSAVTNAIAALLAGSADSPGSAYILARGEPVTLASLLRAQACAAAGEHAPALLFRTCVVPHELVPWAEVMNPAHAGASCWCIFEISLAPSHHP